MIDYSDLSQRIPLRTRFPGRALTMFHLLLEWLRLDQDDWSRGYTQGYIRATKELTDIELEYVLNISHAITRGHLTGV